MPWKPYRTYSEKARHVIETNNYVTVATTDNEGNPWAAPVFFAYDKDYNLYFLSAVDSRHAENLAQNPNIAAVIFDSTSPVGQSDGVQLEGKVIPVERKAVAKVINIYCKRLFPNSTSLNQLASCSCAYTLPLYPDQAPLSRLPLAVSRP